MTFKKIISSSVMSTDYFSNNSNEFHLHLNETTPNFNDENQENINISKELSANHKRTINDENQENLSSPKKIKKIKKVSFSPEIKIKLFESERIDNDAFTQTAIKLFIVKELGQSNESLFYCLNQINFDELLNKLSRLKLNMNIELSDSEFDILFDEVIKIIALSMININWTDDFKNEFNQYNDKLVTLLFRVIKYVLIEMMKNRDNDSDYLIALLKSIEDKVFHLCFIQQTISSNDFLN